jgi:hypothetical protein
MVIQPAICVPVGGTVRVTHLRSSRGIGVAFVCCSETHQTVHIVEAWT